MTRSSFAISAILLSVPLALSVPASAGPSNVGSCTRDGIAPRASAQSELPWREQVNRTMCEATGRPVISVVEHVVNGVDSGEGGNYWAFDDYVRHIQVFARADGTWCAIVAFRGTFDGQAGQTSPGATGTLTGPEDGPFEGGYRATIVGALEASPAWPTRGNVGTTDYGCDISGDCPGRIDWVGQYFGADADFSYEWWGWIYDGGGYGRWINSIDGNDGDILAPGSSGRGALNR